MSDRLTIEQRHNYMADCAYTQGLPWARSFWAFSP